LKLIEFPFSTIRLLPAMMLMYHCADTGTVRRFSSLSATSSKELCSNGSSNAGSWIPACVGCEDYTFLEELISFFRYGCFSNVSLNMIEAKKTFLLKFAYALQFLFYNVT